ncbi:MAG: tetratricopeptide repeat protein [Nitrospirae bacterium]|nr:tetratricopeptide repeat protein [Nitrospirota bacterium]
MQKVRKIVWLIMGGIFLGSSLLVIAAEGEKVSPGTVARDEKELKRLEKKQVEQYRVLGKLYETKQDWKKTIGIYEKLLPLVPDKGEIYRILSRLYERTKAYDKAIAAYDKLLELYPQQRSQYYERLSWIYTRMKDKEKAVEFAKKTLMENPQESRIRSQVAGIYSQNGMFEEAEKEYKKAIELSSNIQDSYRYRLELARLYKKFAKSDLAEAEYKEIMAKATDRWTKEQAQRALFDIYRKENRMGEVTEEYEKSLSRMEEKSLKLYKSLGAKYLRLGEDEKALEMYKKASALAPQDKEVTRTLKKLEQKNK